MRKLLGLLSILGLLLAGSPSHATEKIMLLKGKASVGVRGKGVKVARWNYKGDGVWDTEYLTPGRGGWIKLTEGRHTKTTRNGKSQVIDVQR
jgi:hypothetical protein